MDVSRYSFSITDWIVLSDTFFMHPERDLCVRLMEDYLPVIPAYKLCDLLLFAEDHLSPVEYSDILDQLWGLVASTM